MIASSRDRQSYARAMRSIALAVAMIVAAPAIASAEKIFRKAENETWDCAKDANVRIAQDKVTFGFLGECKRITVSGKKNVLSIASAKKIVVGGTSNMVLIEEVDTIAVSGRGNQVTWGKAKTGDKPKITKGRGNTVEKK
jgi:hypothetical protein